MLVTGVVVSETIKLPELSAVIAVKLLLVTDVSPELVRSNLATVELSMLFLPLTTDDIWLLTSLLIVALPLMSELITVMLESSKLVLPALVNSSLSPVILLTLSSPSLEAVIELTVEP